MKARRRSSPARISASASVIPGWSPSSFRATRIAGRRSARSSPGAGLRRAAKRRRADRSAPRHLPRRHPRRAGALLRVASVAFLGGSLIAHGGQNPIEPVRLDAANPATDRMSTISKTSTPRSMAPGAAEKVVDAAGLAVAVAGLLDDAAALRRRLNAATATFAPLSGALKRTSLALAPYLAASAGEAPAP